MASATVRRAAPSRPSAALISAEDLSDGTQSQQVVDEDLGGQRACGPLGERTRIGDVPASRQLGQLLEHPGQLVGAEGIDPMGEQRHRAADDSTTTG